MFCRLPEDVELDDVLYVKSERIGDNGHAFSFKKKRYKVSNSAGIFPRTRITVLESPKFGIRVRHRGKTYDVELLTR